MRAAFARRKWTPRVAALVAAIAWMVLSPSAGRADPPTVQLVPNGDKLELSRMLPAGVAFVAKLAVPKDVPVQASLSIWYSAKDCSAPKDAITVALAGDSTLGELAAELPPLQFGLSFCLRLAQRRGLSALESERAVRPSIADANVLASLRAAPVVAEALGAALTASLGQTLTQNGISLASNINPTLELQMGAVARDYLSGPASRDYLSAVAFTAAARDTTLVGAQHAVAKAAQDHQATLAGDAPRQLAGTFLLLGDAWLSPKQFWALPRAAAELEEAQAYLRALRQDPLLATQTAILDDWLSALELAKTDFATAKATRLANFTPGVIGVWDGAKILPYRAFVDGAQVSVLTGAQLRHAAVQLREHDVQHKQPLTAKLQSALVRFAGAIDRLDAAERELDAAQAAEGLAQAAAEQMLVTLVSEALRALRVEASFSSAATVREATPEAGNYASIDLGVAVALPMTKGGGDLEALWMPYIGVNLYFLGVDRDIPLSQQRGGFWRTRFALTLGFGLDEPELADRELRGFLFGKIPLIAVGARVSQYSRFSVGAMFYEWPDDSPAEDDADFGAALFVGYSLDLDLIKWIRDNSAGYGGL